MTEKKTQDTDTDIPDTMYVIPIRPIPIPPTALSQGLWRIIPSSKPYLLDLSTMLNKMVISKLLYDDFGERGPLGGGLVSLNLFCHLEKGTIKFNFRSNEPLSISP